MIYVIYNLTEAGMCCDAHPGLIVNIYLPIMTLADL